MADDQEHSIRTRWSLIGRLKDLGDQDSWQEFFDGYWRLIYSAAIRAGLSDAEAQEVVQETVISVAKKMPEFNCDPAAGSFKAWLLTLTRWRIGDQFRKRNAGRAPHFSETTGAEDGLGKSAAGKTPARRSHGNGTASTATVERVPDLAGLESLDAIWNEEWEKHLLEAGKERVKRQVDPEQFQLFDFHVLKQWPAQKVARKLGVSLGQIYFARYKVSGLLRKEIAKLRRRNG